MNIKKDEYGYSQISDVVDMLGVGLEEIVEFAKKGYIDLYLVIDAFVVEAVSNGYVLEIDSDQKEENISNWRITEFFTHFSDIESVRDQLVRDDANSTHKLYLPIPYESKNQVYNPIDLDKSIILNDCLQKIEFKNVSGIKVKSSWILNAADSKKTDALNFHLNGLFLSERDFNQLYNLLNMPEDYQKKYYDLIKATEDLSYDDAKRCISEFLENKLRVKTSAKLNYAELYNRWCSNLGWLVDDLHQALRSESVGNYVRIDLFERESQSCLLHDLL